MKKINAAIAGTGIERVQLPDVRQLQHSLRHYPAVQHIRELIRAGDLGDILIVQGTCSQDLLPYLMDAIEHVTGLRVTALFAESATPRSAAGDFGIAMVQLGERARGALTVSPDSAQDKDRFAFEIFGNKAGVAWNQEEPDSLWIGSRNERNIVKPSPVTVEYPTSADALRLNVLIDKIAESAAKRGWVNVSSTPE